MLIFRHFGAWMASIAPASDSGDPFPTIPAMYFEISSGGPNTYSNSTGVISLTMNTGPGYGGGSLPPYGFKAGDTVVLSSMAGTGTNLSALNGAWPVNSASGLSVVLAGPPNKGTDITITDGYMTVPSCTITLANPAVITINTARWNYNGGGGHATPPWPHGYNSGQMISFNTTGQLPAPLVIGKRYFIQHGTVTPTSFQISETSIFGNTGDKIFPMGPSVDTSTASHSGNTQSGVHSFTIYGESWSEVIVDPGLYYSTIHQFFQDMVLKNLRFVPMVQKCNPHSLVMGQRRTPMLIQVGQVHHFQHSFRQRIGVAGGPKTLSY
jgi:hypothetical protein